MSTSVYPIIIAIVIADIGTLPLICWAWVRLIKNRFYRNRAAWLSGGSLLCASCSALLGLGAFFYSKAIGGFPFYDPRLMHIYFYGGVLSLTGIALGLAGVFFRSPVRWQAPLAAFGTFLFWLGCAAGE